MGWARQHATDNPGHVATDKIHSPSKCETCGEESPMAKLVERTLIETGSHPAGGMFAKLGKKVGRGDTVEDATADLYRKLDV